MSRAVAERAVDENVFRTLRDRTLRDAAAARFLTAVADRDLGMGRQIGKRGFPAAARLIGQPQAAISETEMRRHVQGAVACFSSAMALVRLPGSENQAPGNTPRAFRAGVSGT